MSLIMICRNSDYVLNLSCHHESANYLNILINTVVLIYVSYVTWKGFELVISYNIWFLEYLKRACSLVSWNRTFFSDIDKRFQTHDLSLFRWAY
jgi:hypothetical protein